MQWTIPELFKMRDKILFSKKQLKPFFTAIVIMHLQWYWYLPFQRLKQKCLLSPKKNKTKNQESSSLSWKESVNVSDGWSLYFAFDALSLFLLFHKWLHKVMNLLGEVVL